MHTDLGLLRVPAAEPPKVGVDERVILSSIASEITTGLTYITVARIAHVMRQTQRCVNAYRTAAEAEAEAERLTQSLGHSARLVATKQIESYRMMLEDSLNAGFQFPPSLSQPSLN
ncbi:MAG: hypothetical protein JO270_07580 [Acidobacteriaceae bacterium]|nr:hypothetical protein [Acidobacteriaceae bacterium]